jgi:hypothetical protein
LKALQILFARSKASDLRLKSMTLNKPQKPLEKETTMTDQQHPITLPPELVQQWIAEMVTHSATIRRALEALPDD